MKISADHENNAETFWANCRQQLPAIWEKLHDEVAELTDAEWSAVQAVEGFADGPEHARTALVVVA